MPAAAPLVDHQFARHRAGRLQAKILFQYRQGQVNPGRHAGRGPDLSVNHEDEVFIEQHVGVLLLELCRMEPVRGGALAFQQTRLGQNEGAGADGAHTPALFGGLAYIVQQAR